MMLRRSVLQLVALVPAIALARAQAARLSLSGTLEQGSLVLGKVPPGTRLTLDARDLHVSPRGEFAFGFAFDQLQPVRLEAHYPDGGAEQREAKPVVRHYEVQQITGLSEALVTPPRDVEDRIQDEHKTVARARELDSDAPYFAEPFDWPVAGIVSGLFGSQRILNGEPKAPHFGVDIAAAEGTEIRAPASGTVTCTGEFYLEGGFTLLDHGHGVSTCYFHQSRRLVRVGDQVRRGDRIGLVGKTGRATGPHLHWGMNWFQIRLDPSRSTRTPDPPRG
ncbi:MAG: M23 family metallopeptidase [Alphaproteobacteria bacterium]|nr:M23 family metallopeptidase [Alphaproteobacteria bacterium]